MNGSQKTLGWKRNRRRFAQPKPILNEKDMGKDKFNLYFARPESHIACGMIKSVDGGELRGAHT